MVVFKDMSNEYAFLSKSAAETKKPSRKTETSTLVIEASHSHLSTLERRSS